MATWNNFEQPYASARTSVAPVPRRSSRMTSKQKVSIFSVQTRNFSRIRLQFAKRLTKSKGSRDLAASELERRQQRDLSALMPAINSEIFVNRKDARIVSGLAHPHKAAIRQAHRSVSIFSQQSRYGAEFLGKIERED